MCQTCQQGYVISSSLCVIPSSPAKTAQTQASQAVFSAVTGAGSALCVGSATFPLTALVSKTVQNTRYLNLSVTDELTDIYQTWSTGLLPWNVPDGLSQFDNFKTSPDLFSQYGLSSSFLENFWSTLITIGVGITILIASFMLQTFFEQAKYQGRLYSLAKKLVAGSFNFALVQSYGCLDDILFYLVLDVKTNPFNSFFSWASLACAIGFLALGCFFVLLNFRTVKKYQAIKNEALAKKDMKDVEAFNEKNKYWEVFYSDFNDDGFWSQSALAFLIIRSGISSLIITVLYDYPVMQTIFLIILDGLILSFLYLENPFGTLRGRLAQYYYETITLLVHICTFILSLQGTQANPSESLKTILCTCIIYLNTVLVSGSLGFMFIEIYELIRSKLKTRKVKKYENIAIQTISETTLNIERIFPPMEEDHRISRRIQSPKIIPQMRENTEQVMTLENFFLPSGFSQDQNHSHLSFSGTNLQTSNHWNASMNADDSIPLDIDTSRRLIQQGGKNFIPIMIRRKSRKIRPQKQNIRSVARNNSRSFRDSEDFHPG